MLIDDLRGLLTPETALVQLSLISFYNGHRVDLDRVVATVREYAPRAILALDVTQALGRVPVDASNVDIVISSTHKWTLGVHGGCVVGIPAASAPRLTTQSGGWYHIENAFAADRFQRAQLKTGAASYSVGMPNFAAIYALNAALRYVESVGVEAIGQHADPLVSHLESGLRQLGLVPMCPLVLACRQELSPFSMSAVMVFTQLAGREHSRHAPCGSLAFRASWLQHIG